MNSQTLPKLDLTTFFLSVSSAAMMHLGINAFELPEAPPVDLELARQNIDLLELIEGKTKGNRTVDEDQLVQKLLFELRTRFVEVQRRLQGK